MQSVALGVVVTALVQTALVGLGFFVAGIPHPGLLTAIVFVLCIAQLGPILMLIPAIIWMYSHASGMAATVFLIYSIPMALLDNILRPVLISRGVDLPLILIIAGVIGGLDRVRRHRPVHRSGDPRRDLLIARRVDCGQTGNRSKGKFMRNAIREVWIGLGALVLLSGCVVNAPPVTENTSDGLVRVQPSRSTRLRKAWRVAGTLQAA